MTTSLAPSGIAAALAGLARRAATEGLPGIARALAETARDLAGADAAAVSIALPPIDVALGIPQTIAARILPAAETAPRRGVAARAGFASALAVPLAPPEDRAGAVLVLARRQDAFGPRTEEALALFCREVLSDVEGMRLLRTGGIDPATGAYRRTWLADRLPDEIRRSRRVGGPPLAVVRATMPSYPALARAHGVRAAERALAEAIARARSALRDTDHAVRLFDDALLFVLPAAGVEGARAAARRMADAVARAPLELGPERAIAMSLVCGAAALDEDMSEGALLERAEAALAAAI